MHCCTYNVVCVVGAIFANFGGFGAGGGLVEHVMCTDQILVSFSAGDNQVRDTSWSLQHH